MEKMQNHNAGKTQYNWESSQYIRERREELRQIIFLLYFSLSFFLFLFSQFSFPLLPLYLFPLIL